jgi:polyisoprenoid-binding protein YceI
MRSARAVLFLVPVALAAAALWAPSAPAAPAAATFKSDPVHSSVVFKIKHMGASFIWGRFNEHAATVQGDADTGAVTAVDFTVKTDSVDTAVEARDNHLRSPDFFNAAQFPELTFKGSTCKPAGQGVTEVTGEMTMHGVTKPLTVKVTHTGNGDMRGKKITGWEATFTVKRSDFAIGKPEGLGDEVWASVNIETSPQQ